MSPDGFKLTRGLRAQLMRPEDINAVVKIIVRHREDDAEVAAEEYRQGLDKQFVLVRDDGQIVGVTGVERIPSTEGAWWLSGTYLDPERPPGSATAADALGFVRDALVRLRGRKLFAMVGDEDPPLDAGGETPAWRKPLDPYFDFGFTEELYHRDYYAPREGLHVLGLRLQPPKPKSVPTDDRPIVVTDCDELEETDDAYGIEWEFAGDSDTPANGGIEQAVKQVRRWKGRLVLVGVPSHAQRAIQQFADAGFREDGRLRDLVEDGIDEVRLRRDL